MDSDAPAAPDAMTGNGITPIAKRRRGSRPTSLQLLVFQVVPMIERALPQPPEGREET